MLRDRTMNELFLSIYALVSENPGLFEEPIAPKVRADIVEQLPVILQVVAAYWRHPDLRQPRHEPVRSTKVGRNEPCPRGSGKKFKKCCAAKPPPMLQ